MYSKKRKVQPSISDLPIEILEKIFSYLKFKHRLKATLVCRQWNRVALKWNQIRLNVSLDDSSCEILLANDRPYGYLETNWHPRLGELITKYGSNLRMLKVSEVVQWDWLSSLCGLPVLVDLHIACSEYGYNKLEVCSSGPCSSMRWLTIEKIDSGVFSLFNKFISDTFPELTDLELEYFSGTFRLSNLPKLNSLEMVGYDPIYDDLLKDFHNLPNLSSITLSARRIEWSFLGETLNIGHIREVKINTYDPIGDEELFLLMEVFPAMTSFTFNAWNLCTQAGIDAAQKRFPNCCFKVTLYENHLGASSSDTESNTGGAASSSDTESNTSGAD